MKLLNYNWAKFAEYCYKNGKNVAWNFDGWLGELVFKEGKAWRERFYIVKNFINQTNPKEIILDLMCGGAYPSRELAKENNDSLFICVDKNSDYLHFANSKAKEERIKDKIEFIRADVAHLPIRDKSVDLTLSIGGPEYLPNDNLKNFLNEVKRTTKEHVIFTFTSDEFKKKLYYRIKLYHLRFLLGGINYHKIYSKKEILDLFYNEGFQQPSISTVSYHAIIKGNVI